jgi:hypothetical protein
MNKFDTTKLSELKPGDRFYFPRKKLEVCTFIESVKKGFETKYVYYDHKQFKTTTEINRKVIYLRNIND